VRAVGAGVGIRQYFGGSSSQSSWTHSVEYEEKLTQRLTEKGLCVSSSSILVVMASLRN